MYFSAIEVGDHLYWNISTLFPSVHGETMLMLWFVITVLLSALNVEAAEIGPKRTRNQEFVFSSSKAVAKGQLGEYEYRPWLSLAGTTLCLIITANWIGATLPWKIITLPAAEIRSLAADPNTTVALALLASYSYFYAGIKQYSVRYFTKYTKDGWGFLPICLLEDISKPISLSFRLFGNVLADEIIVAVLLIIFPYGLPIPLMINGLLGGTIQGIVYSTLTCAYIAEALESGICLEDSSSPGASDLSGVKSI